jgi:hypothetical protein
VDFAVKAIDGSTRLPHHLSAHGRQCLVAGPVSTWIGGSPIPNRAVSTLLMDRPTEAARGIDAIVANWFALIADPIGRCG